MDEGKRRRRLVRRSPLRSFALGGLVGAAGTIATVRRLRRPPRGSRAAGLAAFEDAPCFRELVEREGAAARAEGEEGPDEEPGSG